MVTRAATEGAPAGAASAVPVVATEALTVDYGDGPALRGVSLTVPAGVMGAVVGPNGAGKSTLLKALLGLLEPREGLVLLLGDGPRRTRHRVGYVPQRSSVDWDFPADALGVVTMGLYRGLGPFRRPGRAERERAMAALDTVGLADLARRQIGRLSGGQQQRVFLARALVQDPELYLLDEPLAGVDAASEAAIVEVLRAERRRGKTVLAVHHDLASLGDYFDWVALVNVTLRAQGPAATTLSDERLAETYGGRVVLRDRPPRKPERREGAALAP